MAFSKAEVVTRMFRRVVGTLRLWTPVLTGAFFLSIAPEAGFFHGLAYLGYGLCGYAAYRVIRQLTIDRPKLISDSLNDICRQRQRKHARQLRALAPKVRKDRDPRTGKILKELERVHERILHLERDGYELEIGKLPQLLNQANQLYDSCLQSLKRSIQLSDGARQMATVDARNKLLTERNQTVMDVEQSIHYLNASLDHLQTSALKVQVIDGANHIELRDELQHGLDVARQVEERINAIEQGYDAEEYLE